MAGRRAGWPARAPSGRRGEAPTVTPRARQAAASSARRMSASSSGVVAWPVWHWPRSPAEMAMTVTSQPAAAARARVPPML